MVSTYQRRNGSWDSVGKINGKRRHFQGSTAEIAHSRYELAKLNEEYNPEQAPVQSTDIPTPRLYREVGLDIESTNLKADFGVVLVACVKPMGEPVITLRLDDYKDRDPWDDSPLIKDLVTLLGQCTRVYTWYGRWFDIPFIRTRKLLVGNNTLVAFSHTDLWETVKKTFLLTNNKLDTYAKALSSKQKTEVDWGYWRRAMFGDEQSMDYIVDHCEADVAAMEQVYLQIEGYIR